ncbi:MAG: hypothetical protein ABH821_04705 [archaeon]
MKKTIVLMIALMIFSTGVIASEYTVEGTQFLAKAFNGILLNSETAISWVGDSDTNIYNPQANTIGFGTGGIERARIDFTGMKLGKSQAFGWTNDQTNYLDTNVYLPKTNTIGFATGGRERARIDYSGIQLGNRLAYSWTNDTDTNIYNPRANTIGFTTGGFERAQINPNGIFAGKGPTGNTLAYSWSNDTDTNVYNPRSNTIGFAAGGLEQVSISYNETNFHNTVQFNDLIRLRPKYVAPESCYSGIEGAMYYDLNDKSPCYCNGTNWTSLTNPETVCE